MIILNMIVRDEEPVIQRCLSSVGGVVDAWTIVDTGSHDNTIPLTLQTLKDVPGRLHRRPWHNFAHNRNEALALARGDRHVGAKDYFFFIDADEELIFPPNWVWPALQAAGYYIPCDYNNLHYMRLALVRADLVWKWKGVVHEYPHCDQGEASDLEALTDPTIRVRHEGYRSRLESAYDEDAKLLESALDEDPNDTRSMFYLAQSYRDNGQIMKALRMYERRAGAGGWDEEVWYSIYQIAVLCDVFKLAAPSELLRMYSYAYTTRPTRAEPLIEMARICREQGNEYDAAYYDYVAAGIPPTKDMLFVNPKVYSKWRK